jgi:hypothetical protein
LYEPYAKMGDIAEIFQDVDLQEVLRVFLGMGDLVAQEAALEAEATQASEYVCQGNQEALTALIAQHPRVAGQADDFLGQPLLNLAAQWGRVGMIELLLQHGAELHARDHGHHGPGKTPILAAAQYGETNAVKALLAHGANINDAGGALMMTPQAAASGYSEADHRERIHGGEDGKWNDDGWTALMHAADGGYADLCAALLMRGASTSPRSRWGLSAADLAKDVRVRALLEFAETNSYRLPRSELRRLLVEQAPHDFKARWQTALLCMNRVAHGLPNDQVLVPDVTDRLLGFFLKASLNRLHHPP